MSDEARADLVWFSFVDVERCTKDYQKWGTAQQGYARYREMQRNAPFPLSSASSIASVSMMAPRAVFTMITFSFILANSAKLARPSVSISPFI
jgi:hypothetical protein